MKNVFLCLALVMIAGFAFAAPDTIYNKQGQAVQVNAPNFFQALTVAQTSFDLSNTLYFSIDSPVDCQMWVSATNTKVGKVSQRVIADTPKGLGRGYGMGFAIYSGCTGAVYSSMKGDWTGQ